MSSSASSPESRDGAAAPSRRQLAAVFLVALVARLVVLLELRGAALHDVVLGDGKAFLAWADRLAAAGAAHGWRGWIGDEVFYQAPLYPYFLGVLRALGAEVFTIRVAQVVLASIACVWIARAAEDLVGDEKRGRVGLVAGLGAALYAPSIWLEGSLQKTALATFLAAAVLHGWASVIRRARTSAAPPGLRETLALGAWLGALTLVRENAAILLLPIGAWFALAPARRRRIGALALGLGLLLVPVGVRNLAIGGAFLPTGSNAGVNFYIGNGAEADGRYRPLVPGRGSAAFERDDATRLAEREAGRALSAAEVSDFWFARAWDDVSDDPARFAGLLAAKLGLVVHRGEVMDTEAFEAYLAESKVLRALALVFHFGFLFPLAVLGLGLAWYQRRDALVVALAAALLALGIALFFVTARFRASLVPFLTPFAAAGAIELFLGIRLAWRRRRLLLFAALAAALANLPRAANPLLRLGPPEPGDPIATTESNLASEYLRLGRPNDAYEHARTAVQRAPGDGTALFNLGLAARSLGRDEEAEAAFVEAARVEPSFAADALVQRASMRGTRGDDAGALALFLEATRADPTHALAHAYLGVALRRAGRTDEARAAYEKAISLDPACADAHHNLGFLDEQAGDDRRAREHYEAALAADPEFVLSIQRLSLLSSTSASDDVRDGARALALADRLVELGAVAEWIGEDLRAAALAELGRYDDARDAEARAAELAPDPATRARLVQRAERYGRGEPRRSSGALGR